MTISKYGDVMKIIEKELGVAEQAGTKATNRRIIKGHLDAYTLLPAPESVLVRINDTLDGETYNYPGNLDMIESSFNKYGKVKPVGIVVVDLIKDDELSVKEFILGIFEWNEEAEKMYQKTIKEFGY